MSRTDGNYAAAVSSLYRVMQHRQQPLATSILAQHSASCSAAVNVFLSSTSILVTIRRNNQRLTTMLIILSHCRMISCTVLRIDTESDDILGVLHSLNKLPSMRAIMCYCD